MPALWGHVAEWLLSALAPELACSSQASKPLKSHSFKATKEESLPSQLTEESAKAEGTGVLSRGQGHRYQSIVESWPREEGVFQTHEKMPPLGTMWDRNGILKPMQVQFLLKKQKRDHYKKTYTYHTHKPHHTTANIQHIHIPHQTHTHPTYMYISHSLYTHTHINII